MAQHVRMHWKLELGRDGKPGKQLSKPCRRHRCPALSHEHVAARTIFALEGPERSHLLATQLVHARDAVLEAPHVNEPVREVDLVPSERAQLRDAQAVAEGNQDHGGIPQAIAAPVPLGGGNEPLHLLGREVLAWPDVTVAAPCRGYCPI